MASPPVPVVPSGGEHQTFPFDCPLVSAATIVSVWFQENSRVWIKLALAPQRRDIEMIPLTDVRRGRLIHNLVG
jgi:hypothetical protein